MNHRTNSCGRRWWGATTICALMVAGVLLVPVPPVPAGEPTPQGTGAAPSAGCGATQAGPVVEEQRFIDVNGTERWFLLTVPTAHDGTTPLPVVFDFHGLAEGAQIHTLMSEFSGIAEREGFVVVFPHGRFDPVRWDANPNSDPNEDLAFVDAMIDTLNDELCLDRRRVYATGLSYGAFMTSLITCTRSERFAAVAPVAGLRLPDPCPQTRDVPILAFHGTDDQIVRFNGGFGQVPLGADLNGTGIPANVAGWAARNGCDPIATDTPVTDEVLHRVYDCPVGADVEFYILLGSGHTWPGSEFSAAIESIVGYTTFDIHASEEAWAFFERFQLPCPEGVVCDVASPTTDAPMSSSTQPAATNPAVQPRLTG